MCMQVMRVVGEGVEYVRANGLARVATAAAGACASAMVVLAWGWTLHTKYYRMFEKNAA